MTTLEKVREAINEILYYTGDPTVVPCVPIALDDALSTLRAWLDAQPEAPEPDWTKAPPWAMWWAVDANGMAWWYATQPEYLSGDGTEWACGQPAWRVGEIDLPVGVDWRTTLRRRPEATG